MREGDLEEVVGIERETFPNPWSFNAFLYELKRPFSMLWVATLAGSVIGYAVVVEYTESLHLANIAVKKEYRRRGIGTSLLQVVEREARRLGYKRVTLEVRKSNVGAQKFYRRNGFHLVRVQKGYYPPAGEDALVFEKEITP
jgi:ribosomal-protein-alanine N-acetyltransferase